MRRLTAEQIVQLNELRRTSLSREEIREIMHFPSLKRLREAIAYAKTFAHDPEWGEIHSELRRRVNPADPTRRPTMEQLLHRLETADRHREVGRFTMLFMIRCAKASGVDLLHLVPKSRKVRRWLWTPEKKALLREARRVRALVRGVEARTRQRQPWERRPGTGPIHKRRPEPLPTMSG